MERAQAWLLPACVSFLSQRLPFHLLSFDRDPRVLIADYLPHDAVLLNEAGARLQAPPRFGDAPYPLLSRIGVGAAEPKDDKLYSSLAREKTGPRIVKSLPGLKPHPEEGLLVVSPSPYPLPKGEGVLEPWGERGLWIQAGEEVIAQRLVGGKLESKRLARLTPEGAVLFEGWDFLAPREPVRPRFTVEDKPKELKPGLYKFPTT